MSRVFAAGASLVSRTLRSSAPRRQRSGGWQRLRLWLAGCALFAAFPWLLAGCVTFVAGRPSELENICSIFEERVQWYRDTRDVEERWGVPIELQLAIIYQESTFQPRARPPRERIWAVLPGARPSSAYGYGQVVDGTWDEYRRSAGGRGASRDQFADVVDFIGWYGDRVEQRLGILKRDAFRLYLAYHEGLAGFQRASYRAKPLIEQAARRVEARTQRYGVQLASCRADLEERVRRPWWWIFS